MQQAVLTIATPGPEQLSAGRPARNVHYGVRVKVAAFVVVSRVAEIVTMAELVTARVLIWNVAEVAPSGIDIEAGILVSVGLLLNKVTTTPPAGAGSLKDTRALAIWPPLMVVGLSCMEESTGAGLGALICK